MYVDAMYRIKKFFSKNDYIYIAIIGRSLDFNLI